MRKLWLCALLAAPALGDEVDNVLSVWDLNRDGVLTPDEIPDAGIFGKIDGDKDGKITRDEIARFYGVTQKEGKGPEGKEGKPETKKADAKKGEEKKSEAAPEVAEPRTIKERVDDMFRRYDQDLDGKIQRKEFPGASDEQWQRYDRSRDDALNRREATRYVEEQLEIAKRNPRPDNFMDLFDMNRDKKVTRKEYDGPGQFFRMYDADKNEVITESELATPAMNTARMQDEMDMDGPTAMPKQGLLERYDANKDDRITPDELKAENIFRRLDKNGDGVLNGPEVR